MRREGTIGLIAFSLVCLIALSWLYFTLRYPKHEYRFRLTVEVETPQGLRTGSGVYEAGAKYKPKFTSEEGIQDLWSRGEAVAVDLPGGRTLFALLRTHAKHGDMASLSMATFEAPGHRFAGGGRARKLPDAGDVPRHPRSRDG